MRFKTSKWNIAKHGVMQTLIGGWWSPSKCRSCVIARYCWHCTTCASSVHNFNNVHITTSIRQGGHPQARTQQVFTVIFEWFEWFTILLNAKGSISIFRFSVFVQAGAEDYLSGRTKDVYSDPNDEIHIILLVCQKYVFLRSITQNFIQIYEFTFII